MYKAVVIDDEKWVIKSLLATIQGQTLFDIIAEAHDGLSGLQLIQEQKPDLAFVDVQMPGLCGLEILQECKRQGLSTLFIVISGHAEFAYAQKALFYNAVSYALKPFSRSELLDSMEKAHHLLDNARQIETPKPDVAPFLENIPSIKNKTVLKILQYTHTHYHEDISVQILADLCAINPNYVSQLFRQEMGETFSGYLTRLRMEQAQHLLITGDEPMTVIANKVGYSDYFYFAKVFKKAMKMTPTAFRAAHHPDVEEAFDET